jgi:hypothetical protein
MLMRCYETIEFSQEHQTTIESRTQSQSLEYHHSLIKMKSY